MQICKKAPWFGEKIKKYLDIMATQQITEISLASKKTFIDLVANADLVVQLTMLLLLVASVWSWSIIIEKLISLKKIDKRTIRFEDQFKSTPLEKLFDKIGGSVISPIEYVFATVFKEVERDQAHVLSREKSSAIRHINTIIISAKNKKMMILEKNLSFLATIASATPFIGLFGTVWGIMHSFQSIAASKNTSLAVVAPGIAEALLATALGLIAAIPALIFYNILTNKVQEIESRTDNISMELSSKIANKL